MAVAHPTIKGPRRRHKRYRTRALRLEHPVSGRVINVGQRGLAVETPEKLFVGGSYQFGVRLGARQMKLCGRIRWCRLVGTRAGAAGEASPIFQAGIAFDDSVTSRAWQEALKRLTEDRPQLVWYRARKRAPAPPSSAGPRL